MNLSILLVGFIASFITVFALCMTIPSKLERAREDVKAWTAMKKAQQELAEAEAHAAWLGNIEMVMY